MEKAQYIQEINDLLDKCADIDLIELVYQILFKASRKH
jgi:hypothetical protein